MPQTLVHFMLNEKKTPFHPRKQDAAFLTNQEIQNLSVVGIIKIAVVWIDLKMCVKKPWHCVRVENACFYVCICCFIRLELVGMKNAHSIWARMARVEIHVVWYCLRCIFSSEVFS